MTGKIGNKLSSAKGMTLAEMLMVVAIVIILTGVAFVSLIQYQQMLALRERDSIAKQLFIAAQNHLTMAKGEGYLKVSDDMAEDMTDEQRKAKKTELYGHEYTDSDGKVSYYFVQSENEQGFNGNSETLLDQMLPLGSIDETVRAGNYIIQYKPETAKVLNVFYCSKGSGKFDYDLEASDFKDALDAVDDKDSRKNFKGNKNKMLGWYGGAGLTDTPVAMRAPSIKVENGEQLKVTVKDRNKNFEGAEVCLMISGKTSGGELAVILQDDGGRCKEDTNKREYTYIIDSVTSVESAKNVNLHFCALQSQNDKPFIAGEDLVVSAVSYSNEVLSTITRSEEEKVNSLYQSIGENVKKTGETDTTYTAFISKCRHLENLEEEISNTGYKQGNSTRVMTFTAAAQVADLTWDDTWTVCDKNGIENPKQDTSGYWPVSYAGTFVYDGGKNSINNIVTVGHDDAGIFSVMENTSGVKDLRLVNCAVNGTNYAGTLAGRTTGTNIENVVAYVEPDDKNPTVGAARNQHIVEGSNAGGLVGQMDGGNIRYSAAAMPVNAVSCAGGLVASTMNGVTIRTSYSGGYTYNGIYDLKETDGYNISVSSASGTAGGLVGIAGNTSFKYCYSTCSVGGVTVTNGNTVSKSTVGGFVGTSSGNGNIDTCYCTGLVGIDETDNAFTGGGGTLAGSNYYFEMVNENNKNGALKYKGTGYASKSENARHITSIDASYDTYNNFLDAETNWNKAVPYDSFLGKHYYRIDGVYVGKAYPLRTVTQLMNYQFNSKAYIPDAVSGNNTGKYFVNDHYGDWPAPEVFLVNNYN